MPHQGIRIIGEAPREAVNGQEGKRQRQAGSDAGTEAPRASIRTAVRADRDAGFSLVELAVASLILSVGSLAVLNLSLHWHRSLSQAEARMKAIDQRIEARPLPRIERRYEFFSCERDM